MERAPAPTRCTTCLLDPSLLSGIPPQQISAKTWPGIRSDVGTWQVFYPFEKEQTFGVCAPKFGISVLPSRSHGPGAELNGTPRRSTDKRCRHSASSSSCSSSVRSLVRFGLVSERLPKGCSQVVSTCYSSITSLTLWGVELFLSEAPQWDRHQIYTFQII